MVVYSTATVTLPSGSVESSSSRIDAVTVPPVSSKRSALNIESPRDLVRGRLVFAHYCIFVRPMIGIARWIGAWIRLRASSAHGYRLPGHRDARTRDPDRHQDPGS